MEFDWNKVNLLSGRMVDVQIPIECNGKYFNLMEFTQIKRKNCTQIANSAMKIGIKVRSSTAIQILLVFQNSSFSLPYEWNHHLVIEWLFVYVHAKGHEREIVQIH